MISRRRQILSFLLLLVMAFSSFENLVLDFAARTNSDVPTLFVLSETISEGEAEESSDIEFIIPIELCTLAVESSLIAHISQDRELDRECYRRAHFSQGPPVI